MFVEYLLVYRLLGAEIENFDGKYLIPHNIKISKTVV